MEETKKVLLNEDELFLSLEYYRLKMDLECIEEKIKDNAPIDTEVEKNKINKVWQEKVVNSFRKNKVNNLSDAKKKTLDQMDAYIKENGDSIDKSEEELKEAISNFFLNDQMDEARIAMGLKVALNQEHTFVCEKKTLERVSSLLFDSLTRLDEIVEELKKNYYAINKKTLKELDKGVWKGLGIVAAASVLAGPIGTIAIGQTKEVKESLKDLTNASGALGITALSLSAITLNVFLIGATAGVIGMTELRKDSKLKEEFRAITPDSLAMRLALKATILEEMKRKGDKEVLSQCYDDALQILDNYRADAEYMMIVEGVEEDLAKRKITICNNFVARLYEISK